MVKIFPFVEFFKNFFQLVDIFLVFYPRDDELAHLVHELIEFFRVNAEGFYRSRFKRIEKVLSLFHGQP